MDEKENGNLISDSHRGISSPAKNVIMKAIWIISEPGIMKAHQEGG